MKLTPQETDQLYVILLFFSKNLDMSEKNFKKNGPARKLAERIYEEMAENNLSKIEIKPY